jgi:hypothetical protein
MRQRIVLWLVVLVMLVASVGSHLPLSVAKTQNSSAKNPVQTQYGFFTENKGQWDPAILFAGNTSFGKVAFTKEAIFYQLSNQENSYTTQLSFVNPLVPIIQGLDILPHYNNYFLGNDQARWATHCRNFARITYQDVWSGIDLAYFFTPQGMKYEYYVKPEASIKDLQVRVLGADLTSQESTLQLVTKLGTIQDTNLLVFDQKTKKTLQSSFVVDQNSFSFQDIPEQRKNTIVIDPLIYSTYLGGNDSDISMANAVDSLGNNYITGYTLSTDFPTPGGLFTISTSQDAFVSKFDPSGSLLWSTYLGGWSIESGNSIALDPLGTSVYITGNTDSGTPFPFPTTPGAYQTMIGTASTDCFMTKLNAAGDTLLYSTFLGGVSYDSAKDIAVDASGCAYITGYTGFGFPTTLGAYQTTINGSDDCFISKINPAGFGFADLVYSTYIGGSGTDRSYGITVGKLSGLATITGLTYSTTPVTVPPPFPFPTTAGALKTLFNDVSSCDAFVTQINTNGSSLLYSTFLGGTGNDIGNGIAEDLLGNIYVCGETDSNPLISIGFPTTLGAYQTILGGTTDCFVTKLNPDTTVFPASNQLIYSTYLGATNYDYAYAIAVDLAGYAYVTGETQSSVQTGTNFPTTPDADESGSGGPNGTFYSGSTDAFVTKLNPTGTALSYSTYLGGAGTDIGNCIALDLLGNMYITGETQSANFPTKAAYQSTIGIAKDAFVTKISTISLVLSAVLSPGQVNLGWVLFNPGAVFVNGYSVYRAISGSGSFAFMAFVPGITSTTWLDTTGAAGTTYDYYVQAIDNLGVSLVSSNIITRGPISAGITVTLTGSLAFDKVNLAWAVNNQAAVVIEVFLIYRVVSGTIPFTLLTTVGGSDRSYQDTTGTVGIKYDYFIIAMDNSSPVSLPIVNSNTVTVGPIQAKPLPILNLSIFLNKTEFEKGETVILQVLIHNLGFSPATGVSLSMLLPDTIDFTSVGGGFASSVNGRLVTIPVGTITSLTFKTINMICQVGGKVNSDQSDFISFKASCIENVSTTDTANFILKAKKTSSSSVGVSIIVQDTQQDPVTGKRFITLGSPLIIEYEIEGGAFPYTLTVDWGDGTVETFVIRNMDDLKGVLKHLYTSRGTFRIRIKIEDASGQSKESNFDMEIR